MPGFDNDVVYGKNVDFSGGSPISGKMLLDGQLLIGRTALNAGGTHIDVSTLTAGTGISITNAAGSITIANSGVVTPNTITGDTGGILVPNWNILGQQAGSIAVMDTVGTAPSTLRVEDRTWVTKLVVDTSTTVGTRGTFSTLASAIAAASVGDTIFLRSSVTEDVSLTAGVNITSYESVDKTNQVSITGKITYSGAGTSTISNVTLTTNSDFFLVLSGSSASILNIEGCFLNCNNNTGISYTSSNAASRLNLYKCFAWFGTTGIALYVASSTGRMTIDYLDGALVGSSGTSTPSSAAATFIDIKHSTLNFPVSTTTTGTLSCYYVSFQTNNQNAVCVTTAGTGVASTFVLCDFGSGSASAISIGASTMVSVFDSTVGSTNTNAITGAGTLQYSNIVFTNSSSVMNVTTQTAFYDQLGKYKASGQPCFLAYANTSNSATNVTGDGTIYTMVFSAEVFDQGSNFDGTSTFTAPVTGKYLFTYTILSQGNLATHQPTTRLTAGGVDYTVGNYGGAFAGNFPIQDAVIVAMTAGQTAVVKILTSNGTKTVGTYGADGDPRTKFSGQLIA